jgi:hypothetical protein
VVVCVVVDLTVDLLFTDVVDFAINGVVRNGWEKGLVLSS